MKIQPIDVDSQQSVPIRSDIGKPVLKSRLKRLFDRPYFRISSVEKPPPSSAAFEEATQFGNKDAAVEFEPSSVCLDRMVQNYMEESNDKPFKGGRHRCNCFNANSNDSSDDEFHVFGGRGFSDAIISSNGSLSDASDVLKSLMACASVAERNLLADTAMIVEKNKNNHKQKDDLRKMIAVGLASIGYESSICKSKWEKSPSYPAGEYEYVDVIVEGERLLIDIDFRSEFEIARSTGVYKAVLQCLPYIFVGKTDRLGQMVSVVSEAAKQSLKKKGMHIPPWRKADYMRAKWLSPFTRQNEVVSKAKSETTAQEVVVIDECGELELIFGENTIPDDNITEPSSSPEKISNEDEEVIFGENTTPDDNITEPSSSPEKKTDEDEDVKIKLWQPPVVKPKAGDRRGRMVTGLASLLKEKP